MLCLFVRRELCPGVVGSYIVIVCVRVCVRVRVCVQVI
jgi:hypothetical protein